VNAVIATDIEDDDFSAWRQNRWRKSFVSETSPSSTTLDIDIQRKATIVFESVMQVSNIVVHHAALENLLQME
jgi:hypothetical protein